ncbi:preprotein translocase subunit SecY [Planosporangium sp. 12N6]|uniref:preprotein translocase subunit SecY n=1 Tax=Planosporangium spinosum TaxID=3402278 RepID=UPI003CF5D5BB
MSSPFISAFKTPDLRKKLLFTVAMIAVYRLGATMPSPGVSYTNVQKCIERVHSSSSAGIFTLLDLFSGGALLQLSVFALGIMPYITASIILQLLTVVIPRLEQLRKEGQSGQAKITQYTRYLTLGLAILQSSAFVALARSGQLFGNQCPEYPIVPETKLPMWLTVGVLVVTMTAGTGVIMWLGELVTDRGIGNGMSVLIFTSIAARLPSEGSSIWQQSPYKFLAVVAIGIVVIGFVVFLEQAQRRVPVQYAKRMVGRRMYGGTSTYIPLKVNQAGVIPVIFASSLLYIPQLVIQLMGQKATNNSALVWIDRHFVQHLNDPFYVGTYFLLIIFFTYFYVSITFNPTEVADNMKKYGGFVPGIRPGKPTAEYLDFILSRITLPGAIYLGIIAVLPNLFITYVGNKQNFPFGGTAVLIIVGVGLETVKQIESQLMQRNYEGFLR